MKTDIFNKYRHSYPNLQIWTDFSLKFTKTAELRSLIELALGGSRIGIRKKFSC